MYVDALEISVLLSLSDDVVACGYRWNLGSGPTWTKMGTEESMTLLSSTFRISRMAKIRVDLGHPRNTKSTA